MFKKFLFSLLVVLFAANFYGCSNGSSGSGSGGLVKEDPIVKEETLTELNLASPRSLSGEYSVTSGLSGAKVILQVADDKRIYITFATNDGKKVSLARYLDATSNYEDIQEAFNHYFGFKTTPPDGGYEMQLVFAGSDYFELVKAGLVSENDELTLKLKKLKDVSVDSLPEVVGVPLSYISFAKSKMDVNYYHGAQPYKAAVSFYPPNADRAHSYTLSSLNPDIVNVAADGTLSILANGGKATLKLSVTDVDGVEKTHTSEITVINNITYPTKIITRPSVTVDFVDGHSSNAVFDIKHEFLPSETTEIKVRYEVDNATVLRIDGNGRFTAIAKGLSGIEPITRYAVVKVISDYEQNSTVVAETLVTVKESKTLIEPTAIKITSGKTIKRDILDGDFYVTYAFEPSEANYQNDRVAPKSSDESVAAVKDNRDGSALVTVQGVGVATITLESEYNSNLSDSVGLEVVAEKVSSVAFNANSAEKTLSLNTAFSEATLDVVISPETAKNKNVTFTSSNPSIVEVVDSASGLIRGIAEGEAVITVTTQDGSKTATASITVNDGHVTPEIASVTLSKSSDVVVSQFGTGTFHLYNNIQTPSQGVQSAIYTIVYKDGKRPADSSIEFKSDNVSVATVTSDGTVTLHKHGTANISVVVKVKDIDGDVVYEKSAIVAINIVPIHVESVSFTTLYRESDPRVKDENGEVARSFTLVPNVLPTNATNKSVTYRSSDPSVATVDASGKVTYVIAPDHGNNGKSTIITATTVDGSKTATTEVKAVYDYDNNPVLLTGIEVKPTRQFGKKENVAQSEIVPFTRVPSYSSEGLLFEIPDDQQNIATVDDDGVITFKDGIHNSNDLSHSFTITITGRQSGVKASITYSVELALTRLEFGTDNGSAPKGVEFDYPVIKYPDYAVFDMDVTYKSSKTGVATVDGNGRVTPLAPGSTVIEARSKGGVVASYSLEVFTPIDMEKPETLRGMYKATYFYASPEGTLGGTYGAIGSACGDANKSLAVQNDKTDSLSYLVFGASTKGANALINCTKGKATSLNNAVSYVTGIMAINYGGSIEDGGNDILNFTSEMVMEGHDAYSAADERYSFTKYGCFDNCGVGAKPGAGKNPGVYGKGVVYKESYGTYTDAGNNTYKVVKGYGMSGEEPNRKSVLDNTITSPANSPYLFTVDKDDETNSTLLHFLRIRAYKSSITVQTPTTIRLTKVSDEYVDIQSNKDQKYKNYGNNMNSGLSEPFWDYKHNDTSRGIFKGTLPIPFRWANIEPNRP